MMKRKYLSINEKRDWLARLFRDDTGEVSQSEKFKAMVEDTRLASLTEEKVAKSPGEEGLRQWQLLEHLPSALQARGALPANASVNYNGKSNANSSRKKD